MPGADQSWRYSDNVVPETTMRVWKRKLERVIVAFNLVGYYAAWGWFKTDVSELPTGPILEGQAIRPIRSPETSVSNHPTPRNNPEDRRIQENW
jgi:hypothetical protein